MSIEFHPSTIAFINFTVDTNTILFSQTEAWEIAHEYAIPHMKIVWQELTYHKLIRTYKGRYTYDLDRLYLWFGNVEQLN